MSVAFPTYDTMRWNHPLPSLLSKTLCSPGSNIRKFLHKTFTNKHFKDCVEKSYDFGKVVKIL